MPHIRVAAPESILFQTEIALQIGDINYGNHLANDAVLRLCHEARLRWLESLGWNELNAGGAGLIMADAAVQYLAQAHRGDVLRVQMGAGQIGKGGFALRYILTRVSDGLVIARVQTGMVCFDYAAQRVCRLADDWKHVLEAV